MKTEELLNKIRKFCANGSNALLGRRKYSSEEPAYYQGYDDACERILKMLTKKE